jgi:hypothetical protein
VPAATFYRNHDMRTEVSNAFVIAFLCTLFWAVVPWMVLFLDGR